MKQKKFIKTRSSRLVRVIEEDRRGDYGVDRVAECIMEELQNEVTPILYGMLIQQLIAFQEDMQVELADNLVLFAQVHVARFTGCPSADLILTTCYEWIAREHGISVDFKLLRKGMI